ncbi:MAG: hypothetical protein H6817_03995 [Phycisphaerales bacterium]|nr:hypothetical protein [Phycisphaerales bacterium]
MISTLFMATALVFAGGLGGVTSAEFALIGPPSSTVAFGDTVEVSVVVTNSERMAACAYRLLLGGSAQAVVAQRVVTPELRYLGSDPQDPLGDGLPVALSDGASLDEVFINLDNADPSGNPLDGLAPAVAGTVATYSLTLTGVGAITLTLDSPRAAQTQSDPDGALFDAVSVDPLSASVTLTVVGGPDINSDTHVDLRDYAALQMCFGASPVDACAASDVDGDGDVDAGDFEVLRACLGGPVGAPACGLRGSVLTEGTR